jgi:hypothetical protein
VHESERNGLLKRQRMLGLAMSDMRQAESAARALSKVNPGEIQLKRALGTAVVVSYTRAFTQISVERVLDDVSAVVEEFDPVLSPEELDLALRLFEVQHIRFRDEALAVGDQLSAN